MMVNEDDIAPGLVVQLDTAIVRALGGAHTNAVMGAEGDRAVVGTHLFLVVGVDATTRLCTAVPLFTKTAIGNQPLDNAKKIGTLDHWHTTDTYFSHWQHWRIPASSIVAASTTEGTIPTMRRLYAADDRSALDDIKNWEGRNRAAYREA
jgi:hypothetical protein